MSVTVNVQEAKTRLSELLRRAQSGEEIVIAKSGKPIARLTAISPRRRSFDHPLLAGVVPLSDEEEAALLAPMTNAELLEWEAESIEDPLLGTDA